MKSSYIDFPTRETILLYSNSLALLVGSFADISAAIDLGGGEDYGCFGVGQAERRDMDQCKLTIKYC